MNASRITGILLLVVLIVIQFFPPDRTNPPVDADVALGTKTEVPPEIESILKKACYDCHSNETKWPWYSSIAPASWVIAHDVQEGRKHLNFSEWENYTIKKKQVHLDMICSNTVDGTMPLPAYLFLHGSAQLTDAEIDILCEWSEGERDRLIELEINQKRAEADSIRVNGSNGLPNQQL